MHKAGWILPVLALAALCSPGPLAAAENPPLPSSSATFGRQTLGAPIDADLGVLLEGGGGSREARATGGGFPRLHKGLGYSAVALAVAAAVSGSSDDAHHAAGVGAGILGLGACLTGIAELHAYIDLTDGLSEYDWHALLTGLAAGSMAAAVVLATSDSEHAGLGSAAAAGMGLAVVILRF